MSRVFYRRADRPAIASTAGAAGRRVTTLNRERSVREFWSRHLRWHQMRRWVCPSAFAAAFGAQAAAAINVELTIELALSDAL